MRVFVQEPWKKPAKIIIGIDIGTTQSAVSFAHLYPNGPQSLHRVAHWPGQQAQKGESKIPTLVYYNKNKEAVVCGAEALSPEIVEKAELEGWQLSRHFKLHLHPDTMRKRHKLAVQPLPQGVSLRRIYADFMVYLLRHTQEFFETRIFDGKKTWAELRDDIEFIIAHPNGWNMREQNFLRKAALRAGYTHKDKLLTHIHFVSEAEASIHFCMFHSDLHHRLKPDTDLIVCDAGGSTVDTTAYHVRSASPQLQLEEKKASACVQAGAIFVDLECRDYLASILEKLGLPEDEYRDCLRDGVADFENSAKKAFEKADSEHRINLGCRLTRQELGIRRGTITLPGKIVQSFFDRSANETEITIRQQMSGFNPQASIHLLLVGGLGESPYLRNLLLSKFSGSGCAVTVANDGTSKAVADGTVIWWAKMSVTSRATRVAYGSYNDIKYNPKDVRHVGRTVYKSHDGTIKVKDIWSKLVDKDVVMDVSRRIEKSYWRLFKSPDRALGEFREEIYAWTVENKPPEYFLKDKDGQVNSGFKKMCTIKGSFEEMRPSMKEFTGPDGVYVKLRYTVVLMFGGTELQAFVEWEQDGETKFTPATIVPEALVYV